MPQRLIGRAFACVICAVALVPGCKKDADAPAKAPAAPAAPAPASPATRPAATGPSTTSSPAVVPATAPVQPAAAAAATAPAGLNPTSLVEEFRADAAAARKKHEGTKVDMLGVVRHTARDKGDLGVVTLSAQPYSEIDRTIKCYPTAPAPWKTLGNSQPVRVTGTVGFDLFDNPVIKDATVTAQGPSVITTLDADALAADYAKDESATNGRFQLGGTSGKTVVLKGKVVDKYVEDGKPTGLYLGTGNARVTCLFTGITDDVAKDLKSIEVGGTVTLVGYYWSMGTNLPKLTSCILLEK